MHVQKINVKLVGWVSHQDDWQEWYALDVVVGVDCLVGRFAFEEIYSRATVNVLCLIDVV